MPEAPAPLSVEEAARQLAGVLDLLRTLVHHRAGRLALEPALDVKGVLAAHLHDDALGVTALRRRLEELRGAPEIDPPVGHEAYEVLAPRVPGALRAVLERIDPVADEPGLRLLTELAHRAERHAAELPVTAPAGTAAPVLRPARDPYVAVVATPPDGPASLHARMNDAVCAAELAARTSHEHPDQPWDLHADLARITWDCMRHAAALDRALAEQGRHWGAEPVDLEPFAAAARLDLGGRLATLATRAEAIAADPLPAGLPPVAAGYLRADAARHAALCARWGPGVLGGAEGWKARLAAARDARS